MTPLQLLLNKIQSQTFRPLSSGDRLFYRVEVPDRILFPRVSDVGRPLISVSADAFIPACVILGQPLRSDNLQTCAVDKSSSIAAHFGAVTAAAPGMPHKQLIAAHNSVSTAGTPAQPPNAAIGVALKDGFQRRKPSKFHIGKVSGAGLCTAAIPHHPAKQQAFANDNLIAACAAAEPCSDARAIRLCNGPRETSELPKMIPGKDPGTILLHGQHTFTREFRIPFFSGDC